MKKSTFAAMILGTIGGILFALGMCMALIPEWNTFNQGIGMCLTMVWSSMGIGIAVGIAGIVLLLCLIPLTKGLK